eukprot:3773720-Alexandrium_andersonii.AAC.1
MPCTACCQTISPVPRCWLWQGLLRCPAPSCHSARPELHGVLRIFDCRAYGRLVGWSEMGKRASSLW